MFERAPRRLLNPVLRQAVKRFDCDKHDLARAAGFPIYLSMWKALQAEVIATDLTIGRLETLATLVGLPREHVFLHDDEAA